VEVTAGQQVEEGDVLVILEAMKMETQIVASKAGVVASISVKPGDAVKVGDQLVALA
jgi:oxaloacetate decarboxylase alpha subunit